MTATRQVSNETLINVFFETSRVAQINIGPDHCSLSSCAVGADMKERGHWHSNFAGLQISLKPLKMNKPNRTNVRHGSPGWETFRS